MTMGKTFITKTSAKQWINHKSNINSPGFADTVLMVMFKSLSL